MQCGRAAASSGTCQQLRLSNKPRRPRSIEVLVQGSGDEARDLLAIIRSYMHEVTRDLSRRVEYSEEAPCICARCAGKRSVAHFYSWDTVVRYRREGIPLIRCEISLEEVEVDKLVGEILDKSTQVAMFKQPEPVSIDVSSARGIAPDRYRWHAYTRSAALFAAIAAGALLLIPSSTIRIAMAAAIGAAILAAGLVWRFNPNRFWHRLLTGSLATGFGTHAFGFSAEAAVDTEGPEASFSWSGGLSWTFTVVWGALVVVLAMAAYRTDERAERASWDAVGGDH